MDQPEVNVQSISNSFCSKVILWGMLHRPKRTIDMIAGRPHHFEAEPGLAGLWRAHTSPVHPDDVCDSNIAMQEALAEHECVPFDNLEGPPWYYDLWNQTYNVARNNKFLPTLGLTGRQWAVVMTSGELGVEIVDESWFDSDLPTSGLAKGEYVEADDGFIIYLGDCNV